MEARAASVDHTGLVEDMEEQAAAVEDTDNRLEATQAGTTHRARAVDSVSKVKVVGIISKLRAADTVSLRRATTPMDSRAAMILSLGLEDGMSARHRFFSRYPGYLVVVAPRRGRSSMCSSRKVSQPDVDGVHGLVFSRRWCLKSVVSMPAPNHYLDGKEDDAGQTMPTDGNSFQSQSSCRSSLH
jgi:hypothetical protein